MSLLGSLGVGGGVYRFWFTWLRELRLLARDRSGVLLLFAMPAVLVVVITLVQDNVFKDQGGTRLQGVVVDQDGGALAAELVAHMARLPRLAVAHHPADDALDAAAARDAVQRGDYRFGVVLPEGMSVAVQQRIAQEIEALLAGETDEALSSAALPEIILFLDPTLTGGYGAAITGALHQSLAAVQAAARMRTLEQALNQRIAQLNDLMGEVPGGQSLPVLQLAAEGDALIAVAEAAPRDILPTAVQQNVPAWALFGMFFVAVPLAGGMIRERQLGITARLMTMPVARLTLLCGKLGAYVTVCVLQFGLILMVGHWLLPRLGTPALALGTAHGALALLVLSSALAATGFGVMLGALSRTHEQATTLGPITVVIAAALGGLMVPVFAMPPVMQRLSLLSPLGWGHDAFLTLFVRGGDLFAIAGRLSALLLFAAVAMTAALIANRKDRVC